MEQTTKLTNCPICDSEQLHDVMEVKDHMITKEMFTIQECQSCGFWFTNPRPSLENIGRYYKSEEYISHSSTNKGLVNKLYNLVRNYTLKQKRKLIEGLTSERTLLDIGSGTGHFANECKTHQWNVFGLEPDEDARSFAKENFNLDLQPLDNLYCLEKSSVDVVTMWHVLEHVYHLKQDVEQIVGLIRPKGYFVIAVPNRESFDANYYQEDWAAYDVPRHLSHFTEADMIRLLEMFHVKHVATKPMKFDSFYVSMLSEKYRGGGVSKAFLTGLKSNQKAKANNYSSKIYIFQKS